MSKIKLSPYAKTFYNEWLLEPNSSRYNLSTDQTLHGDLDVEKLRDALKKYILEHVVLNSHIKNIKGEPHWVPNDSISELEYLDNDNKISTAELLSYVKKSFDLYKGPLYRFRLLRVGKKVYRFIVVMHHLIMDGSASLDTGVFEAISNYYNDKNYAAKYNIKEQKKIIADLTNTLSAKLEKNQSKYKKFWHKNLSDIDNIDLTFLRLSKDYKKIFVRNNPIKEISFRYGKTELAKLNQVKLKYGITPYVYSMSIFALLLHRYTGQEHLAISYPITIKEGLDFIYGVQINTNLIPYQFSKTTTIADLLNQSQKFFKLTTRDDIKYGYYPIADIIRDGSNSDLLNVCFAQTFFREKPFKFNGITKVKLHTTFSVDGVTKDILLFEQNARNSKNELNYRVRYDKRIINEELLNNFITCYKILFLEILEDLLTEKNNKLVSSYSLLDPKQYRKLVYEFNKTEKDYPRDKTIHALFEEQVLKTPNNIAVVYENTKLTYQELNSKANQLARYLRRTYNIKPDNLIVLCLDRSEQMIIAMLGVLKSGGAYVPIDPKYPDERIGYVLNDTKTKVILTNNGYKNRLQKIIKQKAINTEVMAIDNEVMRSKLTEQSDINQNTSTTSTNLVYVIYTSGTTGEPKGVLIEHRSVSNYVTYLIKYNKLNSRSIGSQYAAISFDALVIEIYPMLLSGGSLYIVPEEYRLEPTKINDFFHKNQITYAFLPPKVAEPFFELKNSSLINLIVGGEKLENFTKQTYRIINAYGPTETTVQSTSFIVGELCKNIPIGKPINNVKCYVVVDKHLNLAPISAVGELMIGGESLARGYLNRLNLTTEKFINNPFQTEEEKAQIKNSRLYKTGDLVRVLPDGNLEYIGRNDSQVKIRGYRIELGEIENKLLNYSDIKQAVVLTKNRMLENKSDKYLLAYYVADKKLDETKIQSYLATQLPDYMLPQVLIYLNKLPLTINGKLDKKVLLELDDSNNYIAPKTELQRQLVNIWSKTLNLPEKSIGITNGFFKLGGNSILATSLAAKLSKIRGCKNIKVVDIFKHITIEQLSNFMKPKNMEENITVENKKNLETDIAIIAMSGAFSGCKNIKQYWDLIQKGAEGVRHYTLEECRSAGIDEEILANPNFVPTSGYVTNIDKFDAAFFGLAPNEAKALDPQIRKFLLHCWYILEESGYLASRNKMKIGVFAGGSNSRYSLENLYIDSKKIPSMRDISQINIKDILATKVSYLLGLTGVSNNISTACSTSLVTVVEACIHLISGYCDMAIAGGVSLLMPDEIGHLYQDGMIYSKEGHCRVFDNKASGIIHGSGVGVVLLKRLADAEKDRDKIVAVIKGYAINNDGDRKVSYSAPSMHGQKECIINAQKMAGIVSNDIGYVECHGTGTRLGDQIEVHALNEAFKCNINQGAGQHKCIIGSVKANIGHADFASGIAGLIKVCQMLEHKLIPKQINYDTPNEEVNLANTNFQITTRLKRWRKNGDLPRLAGVSSFGVGGTNAHVIISEYMPIGGIDNYKPHSMTRKKAYNFILPLSAKSHSSLAAYKGEFINYLANTKEHIKNIAYTLQSRREHFDNRLSIVSSSIAGAITKLRTNNISINRINCQKQHDVIFMFPGQGSQYANMSLNLYRNDISYKKIVDKCIKCVNTYTNLQFRKILFPALFNNETINYNINDAIWAQLSLFVVEYSLAKLLECMNIKAASYIGHDIGEYVAATLAGVFSLEEAIKLVVDRGQSKTIDIIDLKQPQTKFVSNVTGSFITTDDAINPKYWHRHMSTPNRVLFAKGIKTLFDNYNNLFFIEVGPGKYSLSFVNKHHSSNSIRYNAVRLLNSSKENNKGRRDVYCRNNILSELWVGGYNIDFNNQFGYYKFARVVKLPSYHFEDSSCWVNCKQDINEAAATTTENITDIKHRVIEKNQSNSCYEIAKIFLEVLGIEKISIYDDFFKLGGDSLLAVDLVAKLQRNYKINVEDIFNHRSIAKIAEFATYAKNNLYHKLDQIRSIYHKKADCLESDKIDSSIKEENYLQRSIRFTFKKQEKNRYNILLTGSTGHVGCNILYQLLLETTHKIYLLVRALPNKETYERVSNKFKYYFNADLEIYKDRVIVWTADIEQPDLGLTKIQYQELIDNIDSVIHAAALVKHYGDYSKLYSANVQATINLLDLAKQTKRRDFHYISTIAVLLSGYIPNRSYYVFDEDDDASILHERNNVYAKTKYEGEQIVNKYREYGVNSNIYRLGNVAMNSSTLRHQMNIEDNAFFVIAKTIQDLGIIANEIDMMEISPVDHTALAIVKLFNQTHLINVTHHIFNPYRCRLSQLLSEAQGVSIKTCPIDEFFNIILVKLYAKTNRKQIELFMLHQGWLQDTDPNRLTKINVLHHKTEVILANLSFMWSQVTKYMM